MLGPYRIEPEAIKLKSMADKYQKWQENVPGEYCVDERCIASKYCVSAAPENFRMHESGHAYVFHQPITPEQDERCRDAMTGCPVDAIGKES
jgi:ferredoxin